MPMPSRPTGITPTTEPRHVRDDPVHQDARGEAVHQDARGEAVHQDDGVRARPHLRSPEAGGRGAGEKRSSIHPMPRLILARIGGLVFVL